MLHFRPQNAKKAESLADAVSQCKRPIIQPKWDGWRMIVIIDGTGEPSLWSRTGKPYRAQTPERILDELRQLPIYTILDGEMVDRTDNNNCVAVTNVFGKSKAKALAFEQDKIQYVIFDCIELAGWDMTNSSLEDRQAAIELHLEENTNFDCVRLTPQAPAEPEFESVILEQGFEGIMVKDLDSVYAKGKRGWGWWKLKSTLEIDVFITGMSLDGKGQHEGKVGRFEVSQFVYPEDGGDPEIVKRAMVNPYDDAMRNAMTAAIDSGEFLGKVCTLKHYGVVKDGLRHPTFSRWREDKPAEDCVFDNGV